MQEEPLIVFKPNSHELLAVGSASNVMTIDDDPIHVARAICHDVGHSLSPDRWSQLTGGEPWVDTCGKLTAPARQWPLSAVLR